jgi:N utilization substance protein B
MNRAGGASRRRSRQVALQVLYALDLAAGAKGAAERAEAAPPRTSEELFTDISENFELPRGACLFARELVDGVTANRTRLDALLSEHALNWRLSRMAAVDRNILRIGAYELTHSDTPTQIVLDEAIELARRFGDDPSPGFVNGVLDSIATAVRGGGGRRESPGRA